MIELKNSDTNFKADLVLLAMGFVHPRHDGVLDQALAIGLALLKRQTQCLVNEAGQVRLLWAAAEHGRRRRTHSRGHCKKSRQPHREGTKGGAATLRVSSREALLLLMRCNVINPSATLHELRPQHLKASDKGPALLFQLSRPCNSRVAVSSHLL